MCRAWCPANRSGFITVVGFRVRDALGFASHSPGGLGVFDAGMLVALYQYDREELLAGLLIFRLLYYITRPRAPIVLGGRRLTISLSRRRHVGD